ncbi:F0F1 ATP synthase subunit A [Pediococcus claussenii]|uniref:ATP synthase subunit a n=1 Tax=Pediococcus claussenii (strain ATCC BAA-344 / DSM 14800 / JCM 18046 / KCTC 3811 / LMG 21948 / P06) TaxID=701521 RepID=G8PCG8_PEDCP|nr:F0F1 ATP synthase subunit A [Pediococcus claussenii]AEV94953.1 ATP synthase F0, A subunit [Pediococcus claussenii ATCC BAA-344]ANZ71959.1 F0F1 ATP synthase subunit A [Pediococcus claussenii]KRN19244.1 atpB protein [Pediococcus claussenii]
MGGNPVATFKFLGLTFSYVNIVSGLLASLVVFLLVFWLSRNLQLKPTGKQNVLEWIMDFTNGIVRGSISGDEASNYGLYAFTLFLFIFVSNQMGLFINIEGPSGDILKSPTADPIVTMTLALMTVMMAHFSGVSKLGFKEYFKSTYLSPFKFWLPISVFEEFTNFLTLGLRLFGNIFAGEMLLKTIGGFAFSHGITTVIFAIPLELLWQGFSVFIGSIQAFVFVTLTTVYISQKVQPEE